MKVESKRSLRAIVFFVMAIVFLSNLNVAKAQDTNNGDGRPPALQGRIVAVGFPALLQSLPSGTSCQQDRYRTLRTLSPLSNPDKSLIRSAYW